MASVGDKIEKGETVDSVKAVDVNHCIWIAMHGSGFGKSQWRY